MTQLFNEPIFPLCYNQNDGGLWYNWSHGPVSRFSLLNTRKDLQIRKQGFCRISEMIVHSFIFSEYEDGKAAPRWDVINGWTRPINSKIHTEPDREV